MSNNIAIDDEVDMDWLREIYKQYEILSQRDGVTLAEFGEPNLTGKELLIAYQQYLKGLSWSSPNRMACKPSCPDGSCPPCFGWRRSEYVAYLEDLRTKAA